MARGRLVYSTGPEGAASKPAEKKRPASAAPARGRKLSIRIERAGRRGKTVTVIAPLQRPQAEARELLAELKRQCGVGGTLVELAGDAGPGFALELQGDQVERVRPLLAERGLVRAD